MTDDNNIPMTDQTMNLAISMPAVGINIYLLQVSNTSVRLTFCETNGTTTIARTAVVMPLDVAQQLALGLAKSLSELASNPIVQTSGGNTTLN